MTVASISFFDFAQRIEFGLSECGYPGGFVLGFYRDRQPTSPNGTGFVVTSGGDVNLSTDWNANGVWAGNGNGIVSTDGKLHFARESLNYNSFMCCVGISGGNSPTFSVATAGSGGDGNSSAVGPAAVSNGTFSASQAIFAGGSTYWAAILYQIDGTEPSDPPLLILFLDSNDAFNSNDLPGWIPLSSGDTSFAQVFYQYGSASVTAGDVVTDICERAGLSSSQIDVSLLTNSNIQPNTTVQGYLVEQPRSAAEILKVLMQTYFFDGCESGGKMRWIPRGLASAISIPESDLGLIEDKAKIEESIAQAQDLPIEITVIHDDPVLDYQQNKQMKRRNTRVVGSTLQNITLRIPMTMDATWARQVAEKALYLAWLERASYKMNLWKALYMRLDPTDVVTFTYEGASFAMRASENTIGQGFVIELQGTSENANNYVSTTPGGAVQGYSSTPSPQVGPSQLFLFDIPLIEDTDSNTGGTGFYFACGSQVPDWAGAVLYASSDNSTFNPGPTDSTAVTYGYATTTLGSPLSPWAWDAVNTLTLQLVDGSLAGDTALNVLNGSNRIIVGGEIIAFKNAVQNSDGTWTISGLLRGLRGTELLCGTHGSNELAILVSSGLQREPEALSVLGVPEYYKAVTVGQDPSAAGTQELAITGADLKPYAPCHIGGTVDGSGNITITWDRRTRIGGEADWADGVADVPLSEDSESYDVEILNGSTVVRTVTVSVSTCIYTAAQQTSDFGSVQSSVTVHVYQKSAQVGRGSKGTGIAPTPGGWPVPWPAASSGAGGTGQFYVNGS